MITRVRGTRIAVTRMTVLSGTEGLRLAVFLLSLSTLSLAGTMLFAQESLNPGDVAVIGYQTDSADEFAWVTLVDLDEGRELIFLDAGYIQTGLQGGLTVSDGALSYTVPRGGLEAGRVQQVSVLSPPAGFSIKTDPSLGGRMLPGNFGDQLAIAWEPRPRDWRFLFALNTNSSRWGLSNPPNNAAESEIYPGLRDGFSAVAVGSGPSPGDECDNVYYVGPTSGNLEALRSAIANRANWRCSDDAIRDITNGTRDSGFNLADGDAGFVRGNTNADASIDLSDAVSILGFLFLGGATPPCLQAADANDDERVDISDATSILSFLFLGGPSPPAPHSACGGDPTPGGLSCDSFASC